MPGPNAWQKRDNLAGRIVAEAMLQIKAGMDSNPRSTLQDPERTSALYATYNPNPPPIQHSQDPLNAPLQIPPFGDSELIIDSDGLELEGLNIEPFQDSDLIAPFDDSALGINPFKDSELELDIENDGFLSSDPRYGIERAFNGGNTSSRRLDASTALDQWDFDDDDLEGDDNDAEADIMMGIVLAEYLRETEDMRGPYGQIPMSKDWFAVSIMWKGDMFRGVYRVCQGDTSYIQSSRHTPWA